MNKVIASRLSISRRTVEAHRARIFHKLKVRNAVELSRRAMKEGLAL
jgi:DNA-binding NarL/FixJ family response regulator